MKAALQWNELRELRRIVFARLNVVEAVNDFESYLPAVTPQFTWDWSYLKYIRAHLKQIEDGSLKKLMIFCPPRHGKTEMTTIHFPAYLIEREPSRRIIIAAYNQMLANKFSRRVRRLVESRMVLSKDRSAVEEWETDDEGVLRAVGVGGGITGQGGDFIIIDDPIKNREEANSLAYREKVWEWYTDVLYNRLEPNGRLILIMTRWHHDDLAGRILNSDDAKEWKVIQLPAMAEANDVLDREEGEALCPDRYDIDDLNRIKSVMGDGFEALYQQNPTKSSGNIIKIKNIQLFKEMELPKAEFVIQSWDTALKSGAENDFSVGTTWLYADTNMYLLDRWKAKATYTEVKNAIISKANQYAPDMILIENKASGVSLVDELKKETTFPILAFIPERDKIARAYAITPLIDNGQVFIPFSADWKQDYLENLSQFPYGKNDDDVDSTTMALRYLIQKFAYKRTYDNTKDLSKMVQQLSGWGV